MFRLSRNTLYMHKYAKAQFHNAYVHVDFDSILGYIAVKRFFGARAWIMYAGKKNEEAMLM